MEKNTILKLKKLIIILIITPLSFNLNTALFEDQYHFSIDRHNSDRAVENPLIEYSRDINIKLLNKKINIKEFCIKNSSICRVLNDIYYLPGIKNASKFGEGIGAGTTLVTYINKEKNFFLGESENYRILNELGYLYGNVFILTKYLMVIFLNFVFFFTNKVRNKLFYFPF